MVVKATKQNFAKLKDSHSDLFNSIQNNLTKLTDEDKGIVAGLVMDYVINSGGDVSILEEEFDFEEEMGNDDEF